MLRLLSFLGMSLLLVACQTSSSSREDLQALKSQLTDYIQNIDAEVGVAIISPEEDTLTLNNDLRFPLMSVFKFHQALGVAHYINEEKIPMKEPIAIYPKDLFLNTYSPLKDQYPHGNIQKSIAELLTYTLQLSDNLACDILFDRLLPPQAVADFLKAETGCQDFEMPHNERALQADVQNCYENWTSPYAAVLLLQKFLDGDIVGEPYLSFIRQQMIDCKTGAHKLARPLQGTPALLGHKTGSGPKNPEGRVVANNDLGFVILPDQRQYLIAVFIKDALLTPEASDEVIAEISQITYQYFTSKHPFPHE